MSLLKQGLMAVLGALLLIAIVLVWYGLTGIITTLITRAWCWHTVHADTCYFRGAWTFTIWCVAGIVNMLLIGFLVDRIGGRLERRS